MPPEVATLPSPLAGLPARSMLGVDILVADEASAINWIDEAAGCGRALPVAFANAHTLKIAYENVELNRALQGFAVFNDGVGVDWASKHLHGAGFPDNLNGTDFIPNYLRARMRPHRIFLFGARRGVAERAWQVLNQQTDGRHELAGIHHGEVSKAEWPLIAEKVRGADASLVLVAMGNPLQELWLARHLEQTGCKLGFGVGALFDFLSGDTPRAPGWVRRLRLEWLFRASREPVRLGQRYLIGGVQFAFLVLTQPRRGAGISVEVGAE